MKTKFLNLTPSVGLLPPALTLGAVLLLGALGAIHAAQPGSPVGTVWDCLISGNRSGIAYLSFSNNGTLGGYEILVPQPIVSPHTVLVTTALPSNGLGVRPPVTNSITTNIFGSFPVNGLWGFDSQGRIIGFYLEVAADGTCTTSVIPVATNDYVWPSPVSSTNVYTDTSCITSPIGTNTLTGMFTNETICYMEQVVCTNNITNAVNFTGKAVPLKRLTLTGKTSLGTVAMRGVPAVTLTNLSGEWYGVKQESQTTSYEFFSLTNSLAAPNTYLVNGSGAGYFYSGVAGLSSQKQIALALTIYNIDGNYQSPRAVVGSFNSRKLSANTAGLDSAGGTTALTNRVKFQVTKELYPP